MSGVTEYRCSLVDVIDGDTVDVLILHGCAITSRRRVRLFGINAPELHDADPLQRAKAQAAKAALHDMLLGPPTIVLRTKRDGAAGQTDDPVDKYGRLLGDFYVDQPDGTRRHVNSDMIDDGHAVPYMVLTPPQLESD